MRSLKTTVAAACAVLALSASAATAQTVPPDRTTFVTFSGPVSVPGTTLPAGTYTFKLLNSDTNRNVVQIFDKDGMKLMTTLLAIPATRDEATGDPIVTFKETPSDRPPAVHYWYYAGDKAGNELVYPKGQAVMIANASGESVMSVDTGTTFDEMKSGQMSRVSPTSANAQASTTSTTGTTASTTSTATTTSTDTTTAQSSAAVPPAQPTTTTSQTTQSATTSSQTSSQTTPPMTTSSQTTSQTTQPTTTAEQPTTVPPSAAIDQTAPPATPAPAPMTAPSTPPSTPGTVGTSGRTESLPNTGSELPLVGLIALLALGGALALRAARTA